MRKFKIIIACMVGVPVAIFGLLTTISFGVFPFILFQDDPEPAWIKEVEFIKNSNPELQKECDFIMLDGKVNWREIDQLKKKAGY